MKIYDCFTFFNELDLLEIRLNILNDKVDYFVLVEATKTHSGLDKELFYYNNKERFAHFNHKIIHIVVNDMPKVKNGNRWDLENWQRNAIMLGLTKCEQNDVIVISDLDEIPNLDNINWLEVLNNKDKKTNLITNYFSNFKKFVYQQKNNSLIRKIGQRISNLVDKQTKDVVCFKQKIFYYYLNGYIENNWPGSKALLYKNLNSYYKCLPQQIRNIAFTNTIKNGGWHFSYLLKPKEIAQKIKSFAHAEFDMPAYTEISKIQEKIQTGENLFGGKKINYIKLDDSFPKYILQNQEKYKMYIKDI